MHPWFRFLALLITCSSSVPVRASASFELEAGDRVVFLGDTLIEQERHHGWIEVMLASRFPDRDVVFRNLGWSADTPAGESRFGLSLLQAGREPPDEGWKSLVKQLGDAKPTVVFVAYGMADSFDGEAGLERFRREYTRLLETIVRQSPGVRLVLLSPLAHESLGAPWPDPAGHNARLERYAAVVRELAGAHGARHVPLFEPSLRRDHPDEPLTHDGIHPTGPGYRAIAEFAEDSLFGDAGAWRTSAEVEPLRAAILRKNEWFFHRSRPANMAYIFGFRKHEQGANAAELARFDELVAAEEKRIARLRALRPGVAAPPAPLRSESLHAEFTPQPHPGFEVAEGLEVTLWAENPLLGKPVQMNFDARGRLWVATSALYPQIEPGQGKADKVVVLEDTTGAGRADRATVFADDLLLPTGLEVGDGGVYVAQSTELLHLADTDGDGKADRRRTVLSGFGTEDTHHNLHTLRWGPDGRLYFNQSVYTRSDIETPHGVVRLKAGGIFRFDPRDHHLEIRFRGLINGWGHQFDDYGQSFLSDGAGFQGISWGVPGATYRTLAPARREIDSISPGAWPKFCGLEIVRSPHFPADWQGDVITADFRAHRVVRFKLSDQGAGFVTREMPDVMRTAIDTFRPIDARIGPDGALYIADWSNPIIQHGEVDFRDPRRDKVHGRIWRVSVKGRPPLESTDLTTQPTPVLLEGLASPGGWEQEQSRRVLVERGAAAVLPALDAWAARQADEAGRLRALWMYQAFNHTPAALLDGLLGAVDPRVRAAAVAAIPPGDGIGRLEKLVADPHPRVRLAAVRALGSHGSARAAGLALGVLARPMDPFLDYALWLTVNELATPWLAAVASGAWTPEGREEQLEFALKAVEPQRAGDVLGKLLAVRGLPGDGSGPWIELIGAAGGADELRLLFDRTLAGDPRSAPAARALGALDRAARVRNARPEGDLGDLRALLSSPQDESRRAAARLAGAWKLAVAAPELAAVARRGGAVPAERAAALEALREIGGADAAAELKKLVSEASEPALRSEAALALAAVDLAAGLPEVLAALQAVADEAEAQGIWRSLLTVSGAGERLAVVLPRMNLRPEVARAGLQPVREGARHQALVPVLLEAAGLSLADTRLTSAGMRALAEEALAAGDARRGELVYRRPELACIACHAIGGAGGKLGPDLTGIGASAPADYLVEALLDPNARIKEGYHSVLITTTDGRELGGVIARETATEIVLRDAAGGETALPVRAIAHRTAMGSLMPAGLIDGLLPEERLDLIRFLAQLGKPGEFDASRGGVARAWRLYLVVSKNQHLGTQRVVEGDFGLPDWTPVFSLANGALPKEAGEAALGGNSRGLFAATEFESVHGGEAVFTIAGRTKGAWLNGAVVQPGAEFRASVKPGRNTLVLQLDENRREDVTLRSGDVTFVTGH